ncbi:MAG: TAXI family TRAP transporter solute-binding subunit [Gammaproteobacteria bacterium]|nr:TAXI family TRAP transporter solute-binding subunit [Gammaproteobacteria bacterium]MDH3507212.1 TAXI family TRAP transporter solute-binding subunit [Gammaproteobacteria bacterium]
MAISLTTLRQTLRDIASTWLLGAAVLIAGLVVTYQFVGPAPPRHIVLATGEESGAYHLYGQRLAEILALDGTRVELRTTAGSVENLELLTEGGTVDLAFVQSGIADSADADGVVAIGTMYLEPLWLFARSELLIDDLGDLRGRRIAVGASGSGTRAVVLELLGANGIHEANSQFAEVQTSELASALSDGQVDAAFVVASPAAAIVSSLVASPGIALQNLQRAAAYTRRYAYLSAITLPRGVLDLEQDLPAQDTHTVAVGAMLVAREEFHPALTDLLLVAGAEVFGSHDLLADSGQFPTPQFVDLPLSEEAERHFRYGPPFLMRYLPFWAATLVDRLWIMLLPLIGLSVPLLRLVPPAYHWQIRRRLLRIYAELDRLDPQRTQIRDEHDLRQRIEELDRLDSDSTVQGVPHSYTDDVYRLRRDIDLVRRHLGAVSNARSAAETDAARADSEA